MNRRAFCALGLAAVAVTKSSVAGSTLAARIGGPPRHRTLPPAKLLVPSRSDKRAYEAFRRLFVTPEGRVIDTFNGGISHSEGQGWGMLMAVAFDDPATFDAIYGWTRQNLRRPNDRLHAWRFAPNDAVPVADSNNATDGDLYIAGALARGARAWGRPELAADAGAIGQDILQLLVRRVGDRVVLLPGACGFDTDGIVLNLSYYAFPFMREVSSVAPSPLWAAVEADGVRMIEEARFGPWNLPPDWLRVDQTTGALSPAEGWPARFSYDAIRIPLNLTWDRLHSPGLNEAFRRYWNGPHPFAPAWVNLSDGDIAPYPADNGIRAVAHVALSSVIYNKSEAHDGILNIGDADSYYSSALTVLSRIAIHDQRITYHG